MNPLATIIRWFVISSANPGQVALTVRGLLVGCIPTLMFLAGLSHLNIGPSDLTAIFDFVATIIQALLTLIAGLMAGYGFLRKLWITIKTHQEVTTPQQ